jgi:hypothetical protein
VQGAGVVMETAAIEIERYKRQAQEDADAVGERAARARMARLTPQDERVLEAAEAATGTKRRG